MERVHLINLSSSEYEHPFDRTALNALKNLPGFDTVTNFILNWTAVRWNLVAMQGSNFHVTRDSCPELYKQIKENAMILGVEDFPEIYTEWGYAVNGYTTGNRDKTMLVLNSGAVDLLTDAQLDYVIGHEMGHIKSGHVLYHLMAQLFSSAISMIPLGEALLTPIHYSLLYWNRMSEFTADRAALLTCQNKDAAIETIIKMAGAPQKIFDNLNKEAFLKQAEEFEQKFGNIADTAIRTISIMSSSHPWTVYRAGELIKWIESGEYDRILKEYAGIPCPYDCGNIISKDAKECSRCGLPIVK